MFANIRTLKNLVFLAVLAACPLFAGCGGGGDEPAASNDDDSSGPGIITCIIVILATGENVCDKSGSSSPTSLSQGSPAPQAPPISSALLLQQNEEFEPNSDLANANLPQSATRTSTDQAIGWYVDGSIDDVSDITDAFAFTPLQTREYVLALCPPGSNSCNGGTGIDALTAFFRVLDQDGNVLLTSEADTDNGNDQRMTLDAGVFYYVTVDAGDTMGVTVDYRLFVYEAS
jgi:hypothetical protein